jgi:hypothetical protein
MHGTATMGRPKKKRTDAAEPDVKRIAIQGTVEWCEWLEEFAESCRTDVSKVIDTCLADAAKARGFRAPPKRTP